MVETKISKNRTPSYQWLEQTPRQQSLVKSYLPPTTKMPPTVRPLNEDQVAECVYIYRAAFGSNVANKCVYPQGSTPELIDFFKKRYIDASLNDPKSHYIGAFDDASGEVIAYAIWDLVDEEARQRDKEKAAKGEQDPQPPGINVAARKDFFEKMENAQKTWMGAKDFWQLSYLGTRPNRARKGAGRGLLQWGFDQGNEHGMDCYVFSTPAGKPLYDRAGFKVMEEIEHDLNQFGVNSPYTSWAMVRHPQHP